MLFCYAYEFLVDLNYLFAYIHLEYADAAGATVPVEYRQTTNIIRTLVGNNIVYHSDVFGASPVGAASTTSSFST